jgi:RNA polymerase sigma-70 factor (ECF subfamily)
MMKRDDETLRSRTKGLLQRAQAGDSRAMGMLYSLYFRRLSKWAHGLLPADARDLLETPDFVQRALTKTLRRLHHIEPGGHFERYVQAAIRNEVRNEIRRVRRLPGRKSLPRHASDGSPNVIDTMIHREQLARYRRCARALPAHARQALKLRAAGRTYREIGRALGLPSADAARMLVGRTVTRLAEDMKRDEAGE